MGPPPHSHAGHSRCPKPQWTGVLERVFELERSRMSSFQKCAYMELSGTEG